MFQTALTTPSPVLMTGEQISIGLEKSFEDLEYASALLERLSFAREAFSEIPDHNIDNKTLALFASTFLDVRPDLVPFVSTKALESSLENSSGTQKKAFALESGDGIIASIINFIKGVITKILDFFKDLFGFQKKKAEKLEEISQKAEVVQEKVKEELAKPKEESEYDKAKKLSGRDIIKQAIDRQIVKNIKELGYEIKTTKFFEIGYKDNKINEKTIEDIFILLDKTYQDIQKSSSKLVESFNKNKIGDFMSKLKQTVGGGLVIHLVPKIDHFGTTDFYIQENLHSSIRHTYPPVVKLDDTFDLPFDYDVNKNLHPIMERSGKVLDDTLKLISESVADINKVINTYSSSENQDTEILTDLKIYIQLLRSLLNGFTSHTLKANDYQEKMLASIVNQQTAILG